MKGRINFIFMGEEILWDTDTQGNFPDDILELNLQNQKLKEFNLTQKFPKLLSLNLNNNKITEIFIDGNNFPNLSSLYIMNNQIKTFKTQNLNNLRVLYISENNLTSFENPSDKLIELYISNNKLTSFNDINFKYLTRLNIAHNKISSLNLKNFPYLTELDISFNKIKIINFELINLFNLYKFDCRRDIFQNEDYFEKQKILKRRRIYFLNEKSKNINKINVKKINELIGINICIKCNRIINSTNKINIRKFNSFKGKSRNYSSYTCC